MCRLPILMVLALLLAACQSPESPSPESGTETAANEAAAENNRTAEAKEAAPEPCRISVGWDPWEPYHYAPVGIRVQGLDVDLISTMAQEVGCELAWEQGSWAGMLQLIRSGEIDLLPGATRTPERESFAYFSEPYRQESFRIHVRADETEKWSGMSLAELLKDGFRLGLTRGYIYGKQFEEVLENPQWQDQLIEVPVGELNFLNLMDFRIDGFLEDPFVAASIDHRRDWGVTFEALPLDIHSGGVHLMFSKESSDPGLVERFDAALAELRESGEYQRILDRYMKKD